MHQLQFYIRRTAQPTEQRAPWDDIAFVFAVDSDELSAALKSAYPHYRTLRERKHAAVIDFFQYELQVIQTNDTSPSCGFPNTSPLPSDSQMEVRDGTHSTDLRASPASPASSINSTANRESDKRRSVQTLPADPTLATSSTQLVFNAFDGRPMQQRTKRKMTSHERRDYQETRRRGACAKCKRLKAKVRQSESNYRILALINCSVHTLPMSRSHLMVQSRLLRASKGK